MIETRKTVPGWRVLDKWAVLIGGGSNHRMGLYDMIMVKDNHVTAAGGITNAVAKCQVSDKCFLFQKAQHLDGRDSFPWRCNKLN